MDFSTAYFGKPLLSLEYIDIVNYFLEARQETENIEFKSYPERATFDVGLQNAIRGISAFLNSTGGILIWGSPKGTKQEGKSEEVFLGELCTVKELKEKDSLINKISSAITPLPIGITVQILSSGSNYIYIFEIQPSIYKPHQYDTRYYVRLDGQTKPAPHYLIEALMKRITYPSILGYVRFNGLTSGVNNLPSLEASVIIFNMSHYQNEEDVEFTLSCPYGQFINNTSHNTKIKYRTSHREIQFSNFAEVLHFGKPHVHTAKLIIDHFNEGIIIFALTFGGKFSPSKWSKYTLDINSFNTQQPKIEIQKKEENILFAESITKSPEQMIDDFLNY